MKPSLDNAAPIRPGEALDWEKLENYLRNEIPDLDGKMSVSQFHGGHANLTYLLTFGERQMVLRRPPFGKIAPGAHDMGREYKVLSKLNRFYSPAPQAYHLCEDDTIIGARFILLERRSGVIVRTKILDCFKGVTNAEERLTDALVKAEADLHRVDAAAAGLSNFGKPQGYLERQLAGWEKRWHLSKTEEHPAFDETIKLLKADMPQSQAISIVHNDFKFDNCQFQPDNPDRVTSVFDWDMATLGDPLLDFASTLSYWPDPFLKDLPLPVLLSGNFPDKTYLIAKYQEYSGFSMERLPWYEALAYCRTAVIAQQLFQRFHKGATKDKRMAPFGKFAKILANLALHKIQKPS